jgi:ribosomal protein L12E/L44/L45/RPP1/RPP2
MRTGEIFRGAAAAPNRVQQLRAKLDQKDLDETVQAAKLAREARAADCEEKRRAQAEAEAAAAAERAEAEKAEKAEAEAEAEWIRLHEVVALQEEGGGGGGLFWSMIAAKARECQNNHEEAKAALTADMFERLRTALQTFHPPEVWVLNAPSPCAAESSHEPSDAADQLGASASARVGCAVASGASAWDQIWPILSAGVDALASLEARLVDAVLSSVQETGGRWKWMNSELERRLEVCKVAAACFCPRTASAALHPEADSRSRRLGTGAH